MDGKVPDRLRKWSSTSFHVLGWIAFHLLVAAIVMVSVFPLYYAIVTSFSNGTQVYIPHYFPPSLDPTNFAEALGRARMWPAIVNSLLVAVATVAVAMTLSLFAAYAFARVQFRFHRTLLFAILLTTVFPQVAILAGLFELMRQLHLYNSLWAVMLSYLPLLVPFTVWLMTAYMRALPGELEDVAIIDGARPTTILMRIFLPLLWPGLVATGLIAFIAAWNEFLFAFTLTVSESNWTAPVAIALIWGYTPHDTPWGTIMAASVLVTIPVVLVVVVFQRRMIEGLTAGAVSG